MVKNHVGRPSNEEIRKRRNKKILLYGIPSVLVILVITLIATGSLSKLMGASVAVLTCDQGGELKGDECVVSVPARLLGDINGDTKIDNKDLEGIKKYINEGITLDKYSIVSADMNEDGNVNMDDYNIIESSINGSSASSIGSSSDNILLNEKYVCPPGTIMEGNNCVYKYNPSKEAGTDVGVGENFLTLWMGNGAAPGLSSISNTASGQEICWIEWADGVDNYRVYVYNNGWKGIKTLKANKNPNNVESRKSNSWRNHCYTYTGVKKGTTYKYTVRGISNSGSFQTKYNTKGISRKYSLQKAPKVYAIKNTQNGQIIEFEPLNEAKRYRIDSNVNGNTAIHYNHTTSGYYCIDTLKGPDCYRNSVTYKNSTNLVDGGYTTYNIYAINENGKRISEKALVGKYYYSVPKIQSITYSKFKRNNKTYRKITVKWKKNGACNRYNVYEFRSNNSINYSNKTWSKVASSIKGTSTTFERNKSGAYYYNVVCADTRGNNLSGIYVDGTYKWVD